MEINKAYKNKYAMPWQELYLAGWSEHHIHPVNWDGSVSSNSNLVYLRDTEHYRFTQFFTDRKADIDKELA